MRRAYGILAILLLTLVCVGGEALAQSLTIGNYQLVSLQRITRTDYEYTYRATVTNTGPAAKKVKALVKSSSPYTVVIDGALTFGTVSANGRAVSSDTFTIRQNRTYSFSWSSLVWTISQGDATGSVGPQGGTVTVTDTSSPAYGASVQIPSGSLTTEQPITITVVPLQQELPAGIVPAGSPIDFGPSGTTFTLPATIAIPYVDNDNDGIVDGTESPATEIVVKTLSVATGQWADVEILQRDLGNHILFAATTHFSTWVAAVPSTSSLFDHFDNSEKHEDWIKVSEGTLGRSTWTANNIRFNRNASVVSLSADATGNTWTAAEIDSAKKCLNGSYEAKFKAAAGNEFVTGFFTYFREDNLNDEIDVEVYGERPTSVDFVVWSPASGVVRKHAARIHFDTGKLEELYDNGSPVELLPDDKEKRKRPDFRVFEKHAYRFEWSAKADSVKSYVDGVEIWEKKGTSAYPIPTRPSQVILNTWIHDNWTGDPDVTRIRSTTEVDYVWVSKEGNCAVPSAPSQSWFEDFQSANWSANWTAFGSGERVRVQDETSVNGTEVLRIYDNVAVSGPPPPYVYRQINVPAGATMVTLDLSLRIRSYTQNNKQGPHILLVDSSQPSDPTGLMYHFVSFETEYLPGRFNQGLNGCENTRGYKDTGFAPTIDTWYDMRIVADLTTGTTRLLAKPSGQSTYTDYGSYAKDSCSTGKIDRVYLGAGWSTQTGALVYYDNVGVQFE
jgi:hypothetical protein